MLSCIQGRGNHEEIFGNDATVFSTTGSKAYPRTTKTATAMATAST